MGHGTTRNKLPNCMIVLVLAKIDRLSSYSIVHMKCPGNHVQPLWVPCCLSHSSENALKEGGKLQEGGLWEGRCSNCTVSVSSDEVTTGLCWAPRLQSVEQGGTSVQHSGHAVLCLQLQKEGRTQETVGLGSGRCLEELHSTTLAPSYPST